MGPSYAEIAYMAYRESVGGKAFNGDPLPTWQEMEGDEKKTKLVTAWRAAADAVLGEVKNRKPAYICDPSYTPKLQRL